MTRCGAGACCVLRVMRAPLTCFYGFRRVHQVWRAMRSDCCRALVHVQRWHALRIIRRDAASTFTRRGHACGAGRVQGRWAVSRIER